MTELIAVVARARNGVIGLNNKMPWHLPEDLKHFRALTLGHSIIMGRKTFESIGRPLPQRRMIVVTRSAHTLPDYAHPANSIEAALHLCSTEDKAFIVGGAQIYRQTLPLCTRIVLTEIDIEVVGDAWFADPDPLEWIREQSEEFVSSNKLPFSINRYRRRLEHEQSAFA